MIEGNANDRAPAWALPWLIRCEWCQTTRAGRTIVGVCWCMRCSCRTWHYRVDVFDELTGLGGEGLIPAVERIMERDRAAGGVPAEVLIPGARGNPVDAPPPATDDPPPCPPPKPPTGGASSET